MTNDDFALANMAALEQVSRLEKPENASGAAPLATERKPFWGVDDNAARYKASTNPSVPTVGGPAPRSYYMSQGGAPNAVGGGNSIYTRLLLSIYRAGNIDHTPINKGEFKIENEKEIVQEDDDFMSLGNELFAAKPASNTQSATGLFEDNTVVTTPKISVGTSNQVSAIIVAGIAKIITSIALNWARERKVPIEVL